jgi:hypothetical protein
VYRRGDKKNKRKKVEEEESRGVVGLIMYPGGGVNRIFSGSEALHSVPPRPSGKGTSEIG